jgi:hypothetical protein
LSAPGFDLLNDIRAALGPMGPLQTGAFLGLEHVLIRQDERVRALKTALSSAEGYLLNAAIDLETGAPKRTALATINGGLRLVREAQAVGFSVGRGTGAEPKASQPHPTTPEGK